MTYFKLFARSQFLYFVIHLFCPLGLGSHLRCCVSLGVAWAPRPQGRGRPRAPRTPAPLTGSGGCQVATCWSSCARCSSWLSGQVAKPVGGEHIPGRLSVSRGSLVEHGSPSGHTEGEAGGLPLPPGPTWSGCTRFPSRNCLVVCARRGRESPSWAPLGREEDVSVVGAGGGGGACREARRVALAGP